MKRTKKIFVYSAAVLLTINLVACKGKSSQKETDTAATETSTKEDDKKSVDKTNEPKNYKVVFTPDSALLGKNKEALVKITGSNAVALQNPDGKDIGMELSIKLTATNKDMIGQGNSVSVSYSDSRLALDNGTNITIDSGSDFLRANQEATSREETWTYKIPAGAKPTALNLFFNETRASVKINLED